MTDVVIRRTRPGDGEALARIWRDMGTLFTELNPHTFQVPTAEGLPEWFEGHIARGGDAQDRIGLVAEVGGAVVGVLSAALHEPIDPAGRELQTDFNRWRLHVNSLGVLASHRRDGVGSALMQAVEEWGREKGAEVVILETETNNPTSVPFYEQRMGFSAQAFVYRKEIAG